MGWTTPGSVTPAMLVVVSTACATTTTVSCVCLSYLSNLPTLNSKIRGHSTTRIALSTQGRQRTDSLTSCSLSPSNLLPVTALGRDAYTGCQLSLASIIVNSGNARTGSQKSPVATLSFLVTVADNVLEQAVSQSHLVTYHASRSLFCAAVGPVTVTACEYFLRPPRRRTACGQCGRQSRPQMTPHPSSSSPLSSSVS